MKKELPQKYSDNIFQKIFRKIKTIFYKKENEKDNTIEQADSQKIENSKFVEQVKIEESQEAKKKKFMENISNNPNLLEAFSIERLEKILQYYKEENNKKAEILKRIDNM